MPTFFAAAAADHAGVLLALFLTLAAAKLMAEVFERLKQPAVVGEILAGVVIGPSVLGLVQPSELIGVLGSTWRVRESASALRVADILGILRFGNCGSISEDANSPFLTAGAA